MRKITKLNAVSAPELPSARQWDNDTQNKEQSTYEYALRISACNSVCARIARSCGNRPVSAIGEASNSADSIGTCFYRQNWLAGPPKELSSTKIP
jgi:hypothetical protein